MSDALDLLMFVALCALLLMGYPAALTLGGTALTFALLGWTLGVFDLAFLSAIPSRIFGATQNDVLLAVPLFIFMGVMLERSRVAKELLESMARLFGPLRGGLGISVFVVGALLAASTGIVGATVVTMGLLSLPTMLKRGYDPALAAGAIAASGTLGQIIPPSIVLVLLGDALSSAYQQAQLRRGVTSPDTVTVGDLFAGALIPGLVLVALYILYQLYVAFVAPASSPAMPPSAGAEPIGRAAAKAVRALIAPLALIVTVLGSILIGAATPTEAAALGAAGATLLAGYKLSEGRSLGTYPILVSAGAVVLLVVLTQLVDLRTDRSAMTPFEQIAIATAVFLCTAIASGVALSLFRTFRAGILRAVMDQTTQVTATVFLILIGAAIFSVVFRGLGGDQTIHELLGGLPGGATGALVAVMAAVFVLGFFLDFLEITFIVVPVAAPALLMMGVDPIWLGIMFALNLQTSFLTPPFGFALFYLRSVAPREITTLQIYRGVVPFVFIQLTMLLILALFPGLATWLPTTIFD